MSQLLHANRAGPRGGADFLFDLIHGVLLSNCAVIGAWCLAYRPPASVASHVAKGWFVPRFSSPSQEGNYLNEQRVTSDESPLLVGASAHEGLAEAILERRAV